MTDESSRLETIGEGEPDGGSLSGQARRAIERANALADHEVPTVDAPATLLLEWLAATGPGSAPGVSRWLTQVWLDRADLQDSFPGLFLDPEQRDRFLLWASAHAVHEYGAPDALRPVTPPGVTDITPPTVTLDDVGPLTHGITVVGFLGLILGLGAAGRAMAAAAHATGLPTRTVAWDQNGSLHRVPWRDDLGEHLAGPPLDTLLLCVNGEQTPTLVRALGPRAVLGRRRIGLWFWEADRLPAAHAAGLSHLDEVWVASEFVAEAVRAAAPVGFPIHVVPLGLERPTPIERDEAERITRGALALPPEGLLIGLAFDYRSRSIRKNPTGLIEAFIRAFPEPFSLGAERGPYLVLKSINAAAHRDDAAAVRAAVGDRPDIVLLDGAWDRARQLAFTRELDVTASLHRSEGYGYALLEAMALGKPAIATGWSGNLAFMHEGNAWLVPARTVPVPDGDPIYPIGAHWAEPDLDVAAVMLREVVAGLDDPDSAAGALVRRRTEAAAASTAPIADGTETAAWLRAHLDTEATTRVQRPPSSPTPSLRALLRRITRR